MFWEVTSLPDTTTSLTEVPAFLILPARMPPTPLKPLPPTWQPEIVTLSTSAASLPPLPRSPARMPEAPVVAVTLAPEMVRSLTWPFRVEKRPAGSVPPATVKPLSVLPPPSRQT